MAKRSSNAGGNGRPAAPDGAGPRPRPVPAPVGDAAQPDEMANHVADLMAAGAAGGADAAAPGPAPAQVPAVTADAVTVDCAPVLGTAAPATPGSAPAAPKRARPAGFKQVAVPLEPRQVWLDHQNDLWLSECEYANVRRGGRKIISRSSVVRLALDRLRDAMTPAQITDLLASREATRPGRGRPRR